MEMMGLGKGRNIKMVRKVSLKEKVKFEQILKVNERIKTVYRPGGKVG